MMRNFGRLSEWNGVALDGTRVTFVSVCKRSF